MQGNDSQQISQADNNNHRPTSNLPKVNVPKFSGKHADNGRVLSELKKKRTIGNTGTT